MTRISVAALSIVAGFALGHIIGTLQEASRFAEIKQGWIAQCQLSVMDRLNSGASDEGLEFDPVYGAASKGMPRL